MQTISFKAPRQAVIGFRQIVGRMQNHILPVGATATLVCLFSGAGFVLNPNAADLAAMAASGTAALAAAFFSDRKGGAK